MHLGATCSAAPSGHALSEGSCVRACSCCRVSVPLQAGGGGGGTTRRCRQTARVSSFDCYHCLHCSSEPPSSLRWRAATSFAEYAEFFRLTSQPAGTCQGNVTNRAQKPLLLLLLPCFASSIDQRPTNLLQAHRSPPGGRTPSDVPQGHLFLGRAGGPLRSAERLCGLSGIECRPPLRRSVPAPSICHGE